MKHCPVCKSKYEDSVSFCPTDGEVLDDDPSSIVGTVLDGQYQIESMLGKGGMGAVYLARHILLGDRVAIKIMPPEVRNNAEWLRRFRREGQAARRFRHPNAVTVYDMRTAGDGTVYMVMEYVEGRTLDAEIKRRGRFTAAEAYEILEPIMSVLNTAHSMGVVHRDLKPENIMIGKLTTGGEPVIKLLDLGIAKMREIAGAENVGTTELTMAGQVLGTPYYMSPEQWGELPRDGNAEIDGRADIYSLGLVAYEMMSGKRAYSGGTLHELRREHLQVDPTSLHEKVPDVSPAFSAAISKAISKDRGDRQATAGALSSELWAALGDSAPSGFKFDQTPIETPGPGGSHANTSGNSRGVETRTDVNAPTIITVDAVPTSPARGMTPSAPPYDRDVSKKEQPQARPLADLASSVTVQRPQPAPLVEKKSGKSWIVIGAVALLLIFAVVAAGGFLAFNWFKKTPETAAITGKGKGVTDPSSSDEATTAATEFGRYWLEVLPQGEIAEPHRVAGAVPLDSGQAFKFHFELDNSGYLYIVGPGEKNQPTAFLTEKPASISGLENNQISKSGDFSFPDGLEHWLELDKKPGIENYTVIFSRERLTSPAFLASQATGRPLSETERSEFNDFLAKYKTSKLLTELNDKNDSPFVKLKIPQAKADQGPVMFDIRIEHK